MLETVKQPSREILLSVVISTRDRPNQVDLATKSVLEQLPKNCELIIVDQSANEDTATALSRYKLDDRFTYIRSCRNGVSAGRNEGIRRAGSKWIFITDDDCELFPNTFAKVIEVIEFNHDIGIVFGNVFAGPYDPSTGIIPTYFRKRQFLARTINDKMNVEGLSACMVIRKHVWENLNGFDELLGAGAPLRSGAETDFTMRSLLAGYSVLETPQIRIIHHGFRTWEQSHVLASRYWFGSGAAFARCLSGGNFAVCILISRLFFRWIVGGRSHTAISLGRRRRDLRCVLWFTQGFFSAIKMRSFPKEMNPV